MEAWGLVQVRWEDKWEWEVKWEVSIDGGMGVQGLGGRAVSSGGEVQDRWQWWLLDEEFGSCSLKCWDFSTDFS